MTAVESAATTRRRGRVLDDAIRQAVLTELAARGYAELTFEGVARRALTSKPVIYRRYASRAHMVVDAWAHDPLEREPLATTGSLRGDLLALGRAVSQRFEALGIDTIRGLLAEVSPDQVQHFVQVTTSWVPEALATVYDLARARGELDAGALPPRVANLPIVLARHELLFHGTLDEATLVDTIDTVCLPLLTGAKRAD